MQAARLGAFAGVHFFASFATYANADCTGERRVFGAGKPLGVSFSTSRTPTAANRSVYWGSYRSTGLLTGQASATKLVRQDSLVASAIAQGMCYAPR